MKKILKQIVFAKCKCGVRQYRKRRPARKHYVCPVCGQKVVAHENVSELVKK